MGNEVQLFVPFVPLRFRVSMALETQRDENHEKTRKVRRYSCPSSLRDFVFQWPWKVELEFDDGLQVFKVLLPNTKTRKIAVARCYRVKMQLPASARCMEQRLI